MAKKRSTLHEMIAQVGQQRAADVLQRSQATISRIATRRQVPTTQMLADAYQAWRIDIERTVLEATGAIP